MAHNGKIPARESRSASTGTNTVKANGGKVEWVKHVIDYSTRTGGGMQIPVVDIDGDGDPGFRRGGQERAVPVRESDQEKMSLIDAFSRPAVILKRWI